MGGSVNVGFRFRSGEIICQNRHTNPTPYWFINSKMYNGDEDYIRDYLSKAEYPEHVPVAPCDYGLILFDFVDNILYDMNGYSSYDSRDFSHFCNAINSNDLEPEELEAWQLLLDEKRITIKNYQLNKKTNIKNVESVPLPETIITAMSLYEYGTEQFRTEMRKYDNKIKNDIFTYSRLGIDTSPLKYKKIEERDLSGYLKLLKDNKFPLTEDDLAVWQEVIKEYEDDMLASEEYNKK